MMTMPMLSIMMLLTLMLNVRPLTTQRAMTRDADDDMMRAAVYVMLRG